MGTEHIKQEYNSLKTRYNLPPFEKLDSEFELSTIEKTEFLIREARKKITEKIDFFCEIIEGLLQPDTGSLSDMHECRFLDEDEKDGLYKLYKRLMFLNKSSMLLSIDSTNEDEAKFINTIHKEWPELKQEILKYIHKVRDSWRNESHIEEELGYLG